MVESQFGLMTKSSPNLRVSPNIKLSQFSAEISLEEDLIITACIVIF